MEFTKWVCECTDQDSFCNYCALLHAEKLLIAESEEKCAS